MMNEHEQLRQTIDKLKQSQIADQQLLEQRDSEVWIFFNRIYQSIFFFSID